MAGDGDRLPVSAFPVDGTFPSGTTPVREAGHRAGAPDLGSVHLHRLRQVRHGLPARRDPDEGLPGGRRRRRPAGFQSKEFKSRDLPDHRLTIQVAPDDCTGCGVCVDVCPAKSKTEVKTSRSTSSRRRNTGRRAAALDFFQSIPPLDRSLIAHDTVKGAQVLEPLFEFSLACNGCGETPYLKLGLPALRRPG